MVELFRLVVRVYVVVYRFIFSFNNESILFACFDFDFFIDIVIVEVILDCRLVFDFRLEYLIIVFLFFFCVFFVKVVIKSCRLE